MFVFLDNFEFHIVILLNEGVKTIFDFIFGSACDPLTDLGPLAAKFSVELDKFTILLVSPLLVFDPGVQFVDEALSDLLSCFRAKGFREDLPVFANFFDKSDDGFILMGGPYFLVSARLGEPTVPVETLVLVSVVHKGGDGAPFLGVVLVKLQ